VDEQRDDFDAQMEREQLHHAAQDGDLNRVRQLIAEGFSVNAFDDDVHWTPLHYAATKGHLDVMKALIEAGADVNAHDEARIGNTPLGEVAGNCSYEVAKVLIDGGADPRIPGWMQITALQHSAERKRPEGVRVHELLRQATDRPRRS
jgi:ankyrin repeat protein